MAKGIRSKAKKQSRSLLRQTLTEPIVKKRQAAIAESLSKSIDEQNGSTIKNLKGLFPAGGLAPKANVTVEQTSMELDNDEEVKTSSKKSVKDNKPKVIKGSKPRSNPNKPLTWF